MISLPHSPITELIKSSILCLALQFAVFTAAAQLQLTPTVIAGTGNYCGHPGQLEISYTAGEEAAVSTAGNLNGLHLTQGFHQPEEVGILTALQEQRNTSTINLALYPNPTAQMLYVGFEMPRAGKVNLMIYDLEGHFIQSIYSGDYFNGSNIEHFDVSKLAAGNYLLTVQFSDAAGEQYINTKQFSVTH